MKQLVKKILYACRNWRSHVQFCRGARIGGLKTKFGGWNRIGENSFFAGKLGRYSYVGDDCHIVAEIGRYCSIANHVNTVSGTHPTSDWVSTHPIFYSSKCPSGISFVTSDQFEENTGTIKIGNDVWIGDGATVLGGLNIGDGAIIAAGAVVTKDVLPFEIVGGVPAKLIRMRFSDEQINFLNQIRWWEKDEDWLREHIAEFSNIEVFKEENK